MELRLYAYFPSGHSYTPSLIDHVSLFHCLSRREHISDLLGVMFLFYRAANLSQVCIKANRQVLLRPSAISVLRACVVT